MMVLNVFLYALLSIWSFASLSLVVTDVDQDIQEQEQRHFILDHETLTFIEIERTPETVDSLIALGHFTRNRDARVSYHVAREALNLSQSIGYTEGQAEAHNLVGIKYLDFGDYELALEHYISSLEIQENLENKEGVAGMLANIGLVHIEQADFEKATEFLTASIELREQLGMSEGSYIVINNLGVIHRRQGKYDEALEYFRKAKELSLAQESGPDSLLYMIANLNIGNTHRNMGELDRAPYYLYKTKKYFENHNLVISLMINHLVLGQLYMDKQDFDQALDNAYKGLELARQENQRERIKDAYELIAGIYENLGDYQQAYHNYRLYSQASDSLLNIQRSERISEMQILFEVEQKDREIELLNQESALQEARISQQEQTRLFLIGSLFLLIIIAMLLIRNNHQKKKNNKLLRNRREEIEKQNKLLEDLNKEKDEFMSVAAHDMRNPLSVIKTAVDLIQYEENPAPEELREYTELILVSSDRMLNLINDLLDIQSINEGGHQISVEKLDISQPLEQSLRNFKNAAESKKIKLHYEEKEIRKSVLANANSLIRIFDNLISNAIKYSPRGADVHVSAELVKNRIRVAIRDNGPGISPEDQEKLFVKFARLSNKPTGNETSTGLGLFIVKKLVTSMKGKIWCESEMNKGSVFYIEFPVIDEEKEALETTEASASRDKI